MQITNENTDVHADIIAKIEARRDLLKFIKYTNPDYDANWHHEIICSELDSFLEDPDRDRLMVFVGPRRGKSEIVSRRLPAYAFGKNPDLRYTPKQEAICYLSVAINKEGKDKPEWRSWPGLREYIW